MDARDFSEGIARVSLDTRYIINRTQISKESSYGFINKKGELIIDFIFSEAKDFTNGFAAVKYNNTWNFINKTGFLLFKENFDVCNSFHENRSAKFCTGSFHNLARNASSIHIFNRASGARCIPVDDRSIIAKFEFICGD
jgi:hypothetical protein